MKHDFIDTTELARSTGISVPTFNRWRLTGEGPKFLKLGGAVRYRQQDVDAWLESKIRNSTSEVAA